MNQDDVIKILKRYGWIDTGRGKGSHRVLIHPESGKVTTVPHNRELGKGVLAAIRRQTEIDEIR
ncbi:type II toxin-antitoxin system HicA family toxin [Synergistaceae bacterium OttesenSCG-928-I11]|nr:type II toxin-antitoxin system HicA family toxin [Synergistaceae bacterium OttesenSCG-928-I11]